MDVRRFGGGSWENPGRTAGWAAGCRTLLAGELGRDDAALLGCGNALVLLTEEDRVIVLGGFAVRVGVAGLLTGVEGLLEEPPGRVDAIEAEELAARIEGTAADVLADRTNDGPDVLGARFEEIIADRPVGVDGRTLALELDVDTRGTPAVLVGVDGLAAG